MKTKIILKDLSVRVHLGVSPKEQQKLQEVRWTIQFTFSTSHQSKLSYICYNAVSQKVIQLSQKKTYKLVEDMVQDCHKMLKKEFPQIQSLHIHLHKVKPPIQHLKGGVIFEYGDF